MLSIIIASVDKLLQEEVKINIEQTVGCDYEILAFDNANGQKSLCQIYNEGVRQARFELLCFMHEDVSIKKADWGNVVADLFHKNSRLGVLGIAGSTYKSLTPSGWFTHSHVVEMEHTNIIQSYKYSRNDTFHNCRNPTNQNPVKVAVADGVWLCTRKEIATRFPFDEQTFKKFHCYDIDFCISVGRFYDIAVTYDVLLHHYSDGNFDGEWMQEIIKLHKKWARLLPVYTIALTRNQVREIEKQNFKYWIKKMHLHGFGIKEAYRLLQLPGVLKTLGLKYFLKYHYRIFAFYQLKNKNH